MSLVNESLKESHLIIYLIKNSENERLQNLNKSLLLVEKMSKTVVKETESHKKFNKLFIDLCHMAVLSLTDIENAVYEHLHPGLSASDADIDDIQEISEKTLIHYIAKYVSIGSKIGAQYMEAVGGSSIKMNMRKKVESKPIKESSSRKLEVSGEVGSNSSRYASTRKQSFSFNGNIGYLREKNCTLSSSHELQQLIHPWTIPPPDTSFILRATTEKAKRAPVLGQPPTVIDICLTNDPCLGLQRWESRETALNNSLGIHHNLASHVRKRRRTSPSRLRTGSLAEEFSVSTGSERISSLHDSFFPSQNVGSNMEIAPSLMRSIVHCGVSYLDLPL